MIAYTTDGSVRGECGHRHRTIGAALACIARDARGCASHGGYSDRSITRTDGAPLTDEERASIRDQEDAE